jgi:hypothetical protein
MHTLTRIGRVVQQLTSFRDLHATELNALASELETHGLDELARKVRLYGDMQRDEAQLVVDELVDIQASLASTSDDVQSADTADEAWQNSPKRAQWLSDEAARNERARQPRSRRDLFRRSDS